MKEILVILALTMNEPPVTIEVYRSGYKTVIDSVNLIIKKSDMYYITRNGSKPVQYSIDALIIKEPIKNCSE